MDPPGQVCSLQIDLHPPNCGTETPRIVVQLLRRPIAPQIMMQLLRSNLQTPRPVPGPPHINPQPLRQGSQPPKIWPKPPQVRPRPLSGCTDILARPAAPYNVLQTPSFPILAPSRPRRATQGPPGRWTPSQTGPQPFRPAPYAPQADPAAPSRLSRSPASSACSPLGQPRRLPDPSHPHFPSINPPPSTSLAFTSSILRPRTLSAPFLKRRLQLPACLALPRAVYAGSCSPSHVEAASISPLKPQLPLPFASPGAMIALPDFRACAVRAVVVAARPAASPGRER